MHFLSPYDPLCSRHAGPAQEAMERLFVRKKTLRPIDKVTVHEKDGVVWLSFPILDRYGWLLNAFSTRLGGVSEGSSGAMNLSFSRENAMHPEKSEQENRAAVTENHKRFSSAVGYDLKDLVFSDQTHTDTIRIVTSKDRGNGIMRPHEFHDVDGLMTSDPRVGLITFYADCVPLLIADPVHRAIACVHSGWKGTAAGIGTKAVRLMSERFGSDPSDLTAAIGPSVCRDCYEVSAEVIAKIKQRFDERLWPELFSGEYTGRDGQLHYKLDLQRACMENFLTAGMTRENISLPDLCTACNAERLFSHRKSRGRRGNLAAVLMIR